MVLTNKKGAQMTLGAGGAQVTLHLTLAPGGYPIVDIRFQISGTCSVIG